MRKNLISELSTIITPPNNPLDLNESMLSRNEGILRSKMPSDFIDFGKTYGSGTIHSPYSSWEIWSPFRPTYPFIILEFARICNIFKDAMEINDVPFGIFPEVGGVLPFANTPDGGWVCWRTVGEPDEWDVVDFGQYEKGFYEILDMGLSEYFVNVLTRRIILERHKNSAAQNEITFAFEQKVYLDYGL